MKDEITAELEDIEGIEEEGDADFTVNGRSFEIAFNQKRIELYENGNQPIMASIAKNGGTFSLGELYSLTAYGLKFEGGGYVNPKQGMKMARELVRENGYLPVYERVMEALQRDCGFLFGATA